MTTADLAQMFERHHRGLDEFVRGDVEPLRRLFSRRDDVSFASPFGPPVRGWPQVSVTLARSAANYEAGAATGFERVSEFVDGDLACIVEVERFRAKVAGAAEVAPFSLRTTTVFRREEDGWRIVHRHADPIVSPRPFDSVLGS
ncbi:nuclear transport factor 2 family protein [Longispora sp. K20-0274]|uniref:YybH family protein n=1 Tax=Longispora sp. K20-0274 TaxID=3088255 RepID=UPI00399B128A